VIEDEAGVRDAIAGALSDEGFDVRTSPDGGDTELLLDTYRPDIAILDVGLGAGPDGFSVARRLRARSDIPFLFVTSAGDLSERLTGFDIGADDYLLKPFPMAELVARVRAVLRRSDQLSRSVWRVGDILIDEDAHAVVVGAEPVVLTALEFQLLVALARRPGRVMSKVQLLNEVWGFDHYALNIVEVHVSALRKKLEAHAPRVIHTVRNVGYVLRA
jgi:DNA-binding response OmpR family regulator